MAGWHYRSPLGPRGAAPLSWLAFSVGIALFAGIFYRQTYMGVTGPGKLATLLKWPGTSPRRATGFTTRFIRPF